MNGSILIKINRYFPTFTKYQHINLITRVLSIISTIITLIGSYLHITRQISNESYYNYFLVSLKGYLINDMIIQLLYLKYFKKDILETSFHHIILILMVNYSGLYNIKSVGLTSEYTNIHLYTGWYMIQIRKQNTIWFKINAVLLLISFYIFRVLLFTYLFYITIYVGEKYHPVMLSGICLLNYYWFKLLINKAILLIKRTPIKTT